MYFGFQLYANKVETLTGGHLQTLFPEHSLPLSPILPLPFPIPSDSEKTLYYCFKHLMEYILIPHSVIHYDLLFLKSDSTKPAFVFIL